MYIPIPNDAPLSQGDIVGNITLAYIPDISNPALVLEGDYVDKDLTQPFPEEEELTVVCEALKSPALVIAPNCNIDNDQYISVARIFPLHDPSFSGMTNVGRKAKYLAANYQRVGPQPAVYYLQEAPDIEFPKSLVSFIEIHTIHRTPENLAYLLANRILRLSEEAVGDFQYRIGFFFGRYTVLTENYMLTKDERTALAD